MMDPLIVLNLFALVGIFIAAVHSYLHNKKIRMYQLCAKMKVMVGYCPKERRRKDRRSS